MRIMTGKYKGRLIRMPKGIRPTQDKVRKAIFDILGDVTGLSFLELFAGSGAVGLEALSRGAGEVTFVEKEKICIETIRYNLDFISSSAHQLISSDVSEAVKRLNDEGKKFDIIFLDPPYYEVAFHRFYDKPKNRKGGFTSVDINESLAKKALQMLSAYDILTPNGLIVIQHFRKDNLPEDVGDLALFKQKRYGDTLLSFYKKRC
ncbi:MAG: RsmD family RNA methyltransferase [Candidatus Omnitrophica bacterium]|nr:RsmD family RNA methyltransferase [Candidatus Omnitrophota bacterium]